MVGGKADCFRLLGWRCDYFPGEYFALSRPHCDDLQVRKGVKYSSS
jgi:hypothetical protein